MNKNLKIWQSNEVTCYKFYNQENKNYECRTINIKYKDKKVEEEKT